MKWLLAFALFLGLCSAGLAQSNVGPANAILCNSMVFASLTGTGAGVTTSMLAGVSNKIIAICGWHVTESGTTAGTFQLEYGTQGGPCTTPTTLTPGFSVTSTAPATDHVDFATLSIPKGSQLCVVTTGANTSTLQIGVWVSQY